MMVLAVELVRDEADEANVGRRIETHDGRRRASCRRRSSSDVVLVNEASEASEAVSSD